VDWIQLAHDRLRWQSFVNFKMKIRVLYNTGHFMTNFQTLCRAFTHWNSSGQHF